MPERPARHYRELKVWQKGIALVRETYEVANEFPADERYGLAAQMRRAAVSVPSNIAEGQARNSPREFRRYLQIALGSLAELDTQLTIAVEVGLLAANRAEALFVRIVELRKMIHGLVAAQERKLQE